MTESEARPVGWHQDPDDPSMLRHWNGKRWGRVRRPRPSWAAHAGEEGAAPGHPMTPGQPPGLPRRWWVWALGAMALVLGLPLLMLQVGSRGPKLPPRSVEDQDFSRQANATCQRILQPLRDQRPERPDDRQRGNEVALAGQVDLTADALGQLTAELRRLPVASTDRAEVDRWLDDWDAYVTVGRRYADALRRQDQAAYRSITDDGDALSKQVFVFARANGMPACTP